METIYLSEEGKKALEEKLHNLIQVVQPAVVERLKTAREFGDLSENAEYKAAKDELARVTGEIAELEAQLKIAVIYSNDAQKTGIVSLGSTVRVHDEDLDETNDLTIVGTAEADFEQNKISNESEVGKALLGAKVGSTVTVKAISGDYKLKIVKIVG